jgi:cytochrome o ubiquinol oxidase subunit 1
MFFQHIKVRLAAIEYSDIFGRLTLEAFKHDAIEASVGISIIFGSIILVAVLTYYKLWTWLWTEWLTSVDHKKIGVMYLVVTVLMLFKGVVDALMMRAQQVLSVGDSFGYLTSSHYQQLFTAHGTTMIFFVAMGAVAALMNIIVPLQIGARDVAFPFLNNLSFWLFAVGASLLMVSLMIGEFSGAGWVGYPPLSGLEYNPGVGIDYWIWSLQISGIGSLLTGINFLVTIFKMRCPGMTLMKMPLFVWSVFNSVILIVFAFPILTATLAMLSLDRLLGMHFFTSDFGGSAMMYVNLIWAWGHPEVYILILPAFGVFSEVVATFSEKRLFGYVSMVWALISITILSFLVWLHHFFTMGAGPNVNTFFGFMTMIIAVPTGVKVFNWLFTMYKGKVHLTNPILWFLGFVFIFTIGGMTGVLMGVAPVDFQVHGSLFLIAHFHSMVVGGVLFGLIAGYVYWFPKIFGFKLNEKLGEYAWFCWMFGFLLTALPLYALGLMGATRRMDHYEASTGWAPLFVVAAIGAIIIFCGIGFQVLQLLVSFKERNKNRDLTGDPWNGRTLEWTTSSPPPVYNFAFIPEVKDRDAFWDQKQTGIPLHGEYKEIHMPKNTPLGFYIGVLSFTFSFGLIWYMMWLAAISFVGIVVCILLRLFDQHTDFYISAAEVKKIEEQTLKNKRFV